MFKRVEGATTGEPLIVFYSESLSRGEAPAFLSPPNGRRRVVFAADLCVGVAP